MTAHEEAKRLDAQNAERKSSQEPLHRLSHISLSSRRVTNRTAQLLLSGAPTLISVVLENTKVDGKHYRLLRQRGVEVVTGDWL